MTNDQTFPTELLHRFLADLTLGEPLHLNDLTLAPVFSEKTNSPVYLDLEAALWASVATVTEVSASASRRRENLIY